MALQEAHDRLEQRVQERTAELEQANARFQAMFDQGLFAGLIALDGTLVDINESWLKASGFTREQVLGKLFWNAGWWNRSAELQAWIKIGFAEATQGVHFHGETVCFTAAGRERRLELALIPIRDRDGAVSFVVPTALDITERRRAEQELKAVEVARETEARFRRLADVAPVLIWMADTTNAGTWFNQQWLDFVGRPLEQELGAGWLENVHPDDVARCQRECDEAFAARRRFELEFRMRRHDGEYRWILDHGVPTSSAGGVFSGYIGSCIDITERKQAELTRRRLAAIVESSYDAIIGKNLDGIITSWNQGAERLFGYTADEIIGRPILQLIPPDRQHEEPKILAQLRRGERIEHYETVRQRRDGSRFDVSLSISPIRDETGAVIGAAKILRDISRLRENERALRRQTRQLEVLNHMGRTLAAERRIEVVVQAVTDAGREVSGAAFGAFFYNVRDENGDSYRLFTLAGARRKDFESFGMPRNTPLFGPTFRGEGPVRIADVLADPRYGSMAPHHGMPHGHPPVRSYLAVSVVAGSGDVHGGLFFGHPDPGVFTEEAENVVVAIAAQAAIAIDNANLYRDMQHELQEHARAERALRESEERFRTLADNIAAFAWTADRLGWATWYNKRWYQYTGTTFAEMQDRGWERVLHPDHIGRVRNGLQRCLDRGEIWEDTFPLRRHDGEFRWFLSRAVPIHDASGKVVRWFGTNTDITEQKNAEDLLRQRSARMQLLSEMLAELLAAQDPDVLEHKLFPRVAAHLGVDTYLSYKADETRRVLHLQSSAGLAEEETRSIATVAYGEGIDGTVAQTRAAIAMDNIQQGRDETSARLRRWKIAVCACNPLLVGDRLLGTLAFASRSRTWFDEDELEFLRVVAQSVAVVLDRLHAARAQRESEERFRTLADNIAQFAWTADPQGWIFWYNRRWFDYTGTTLAEMEGWGWRAVHHPDHVKRVEEKFRHCIAAGEVWQDTFPLRRHDGEYRWFLSRAVPIRDADGRVLRWFGTNTDVTEQRDVESALERARDEAVAASRAKDDFLAALSHELRTPLNPVLLLASDAVENPDLPEPVRADFETIRKNVSLEARLIDDLLDLTRISRGKLLLDLAEHDVHAILRDALATIESDAAEKGVTLTLELGADDVRVRADAVRLQQVFWNVLKNAVKFTPQGGRIAITTRERGPEGRIEVVVADTGIGMTMAEIARVFDAFTQGDHALGAEAHRFGGLGLGLAISRMVVELHGGTIMAESPGPGQGATFVVSLPLAQLGSASPPPDLVVAAATADPVNRGGERILLVEDHLPTRIALERLLVRRKFVVTTAGSVAEANGLLQKEPFDLLVSDLGLPDGSGCDLMSDVARKSGVPGIALTGYGMEADIVRSREAGFSSHLTKPVSVAALDRAIAEALPREGSRS